MSVLVADVVAKLGGLDTIELATWLAGESPDVVLMTIFEYGRRGLDVPHEAVYQNVEAIYQNVEAMRAPALRAYVLEVLARAPSR
ncbi:hypothetical protein DB30_03759 [Enhygromyxa salina]|uniref:Uncharacterized protein n=1 Tax=Enhygromyxa salina TaxID=215803 RepID=A0A0C2DBM6_9BACT|nr:hypothetical protein [Enhygromyxa salina]KIG17162.1 hypothetical protein DB30_03759 [Enhygromyxa salina]